MRTKLLLLIASVIMTTGCSVLSKKEEMSVIGDLNAPGWYLKEDTIYNDKVIAMATETSSNMQFAIDKATMTAQISLANTINSKVSSVFRSSIREREDDSTGVSDVESDRVSKVTINQSTSFFTRTKLHVVKEGNLYRAFVKLEIPIDTARKLIAVKSAPVGDRYKALEKVDEVQ